MKKFLAIVFSVISMLCLFTACKTTEEPDNGDNPPDVNAPLFNVYEIDDNKNLTVAQNVLVYKGDSVKVYALINEPENTNDSYPISEWAIADSTIATLEYSKSIAYRLTIKGVKVGTTTVTATSKNGTTSTFTVTVKESSLSAKQNNMNLFKTTNDEVSVNLSDVFNMSDGLNVTYTSSNASVASVVNGKIVAGSKGSAVITAKFGKISSASVTVNVYDKTINLPSDYFMLLYTDATKESVNFNVVSTFDALNYVSSNTNVVTYENGKLVAKGLGSATVTVSNTTNTASEVVTVDVVTAKETKVTTNSLVNEKVNFYGRNIAINGGVRFEHTVSGFEFSFYGTAAYAEMGATFGGEYKPRFQVLVDGEKVDQTEVDANGGNTDKSKTSTNGQTIINLNATSKVKYTLVEGLTEGWHTVKVLKRTPARRGGTIMDKATVFSVSVNEGGYIGKAPNKPELKIEVYCDSISCAYGNLYNGDVMHNNTTNGLLAYHYLAAEQLGAEINVQAHSGWGILYDTSGLTNDLWPKYFTKFTDLSTTYDMSYDADIIVINLGTNDASGVNNANFVNNFATATVNWVKQILSYNQDATVLLTYGMMGKNVNVISGYESAVSQLKSQGYNNVYYYTYTGGYDGAGHPSKADHIANGSALATEIKRILG